jgi:hypothetical protein
MIISLYFIITWRLFCCIDRGPLGERHAGDLGFRGAKDLAGQDHLDHAGSVLAFLLH